MFVHVLSFGATKGELLRFLDDAQGPRDPTD